MGICKDVMDEVRNKHYSNAWGKVIEWLFQLLSDPVYGIPVMVSFSLFIFTLWLSAEAAKKESQNQPINKKIKKESPKVVDTVSCGELESIKEFKDGKLVMCRCWKSQNFPYCDGSHTEHNKITGDNIGPLVIVKANN